MKHWRKRWSDYRQWAETHSGPDPRSPVDIMRDVDWLYSNLSERVRTTDPDPEKLGIQEMHRIFDLYERKRQSRISPGASD
jgi:hypothetical protein